MVILIIFNIILFVLLIILIVFQFKAISDILKSEFRDPTTKIMWLLAVIFGSIVGVVFYNKYGKKQKINYESELNLNADNNYAKNQNAFNLNSIKNTPNILCPNCNNNITENDIFCNRCGTNVQSYIKLSLLANCPSCRNHINSNDIFCSNCGFNIKEHKLSMQNTSLENKISNNNSCLKCGNKHSPGDKFCENCGNKLI